MVMMVSVEDLDPYPEDLVLAVSEAGQSCATNSLLALSCLKVNSNDCHTNLFEEADTTLKILNQILIYYNDQLI